MSENEAKGTPFSQLSLRPELQQAVDEMGFTHATDVQAEVLAPTTEGKDVLVQSRTGTGKTLAFLLPLMQKLIDSDRTEVQALVLDPARELALQVSEEATQLAKHLPLRIATIYGGTNINAQIATIRRGPQLAIGTPGRVLDHLRRGTLPPSAIRTIILDECDQMLSMGFLEDIIAIFDYLPKQRQTMLFSATIPKDIQRLANRLLTDPVRIELSGGHVSVAEIDHAYYFVGVGDRLGHLRGVLQHEAPERAVIFCNTREETGRVTAHLKEHGFVADGISGDLGQRDREEVMQSMREGRINLLVATDVAARGIDLPEISHVINYNFPESADVYVHRTGRTARAGRSGVALSFVSAREVAALHQLRLVHHIYPKERALPHEAETEQSEGQQLLILREQLAETRPTEEAKKLLRRLLAIPDGPEILAKVLTAANDRARTTADLTPPHPQRLQRSPGTQSSGSDGTREERPRGRRRTGRSRGPRRGPPR